MATAEVGINNRKYYPVSDSLLLQPSCRIFPWPMDGKREGGRGRGKEVRDVWLGEESPGAKYVTSIHLHCSVVCVVVTRASSVFLFASPLWSGIGLTGKRSRRVSSL